MNGENKFGIKMSMLYDFYVIKFAAYDLSQ